MEWSLFSFYQKEFICISIDKNFMHCYLLFQDKETKPKRLSEQHFNKQYLLIWENPSFLKYAKYPNASGLPGTRFLTTCKSGTVLVPLGYCTKIPQTRWFINSNNVLQFWRLRSPRSRQIPCLVKACFIDNCLFTAYLHGRRDEGTFWDLFYMCINPIHIDSVLMT